jgi:hypothetical protein
MGQKQGKVAEPQPPIATPGVVASPEKTTLFGKVENRDHLYGKIQIPEHVLQRCLEKIRNNKPIIFNISSHGGYNTKNPRVDIKNFLLTIASTGYSTYSDFIFDFLSPSFNKRGQNVYERYLPTMLNGNLSQIHQTNEKKLTNFMKRRKDYTNNNYITKLYYGENAPHFNKAGTQKRFTKTDKQAPPIFAHFSNVFGSPKLGNFFMDPQGIYLIEDSSIIARTYSVFRRQLHASFNTEKYGGVIHMNEYNDLLKKLGKTDNYVAKDDNDMREHIATMLNNYFYSEGNPMFEYVKSNSLVIPDPEKVYYVKDLIDAISQKLETELMKVDPTIRNPVILFTFLQCKAIEDENEIEIFNRMSNARNKQDIEKVKRLYKNYVSPGMTPEQVDDLQVVSPADLSKSIERISRENKAQKNKAQKETKARKTRTRKSGARKSRSRKSGVYTLPQSAQQEMMEGPAGVAIIPDAPTECKGLPQEECVGPHCQWINGKKLKYCKRRTRRKNK